MTMWEFDVDTRSRSIADNLSSVNTENKFDGARAAAHCDAPAVNMSFIFEGYVQQGSDKGLH
jgi:hypothetical protein